jgi:mannose-6-phosphate isomerase-like protein (cupin superfamily)
MFNERNHTMQAIKHAIAAGEGEHVRFWENLGTRRLVPGLVEHDLPPKRLGAPTHTHTNEDEYSYILSGRLTAQIGDDVVEAGPGELVLKPRGIPHAMWNAGDEPVRFLEFISPAGFENYFFELAEPLNAGDMEAAGAVMARYELDLDMASVERLVDEHGLDG